MSFAGDRALSTPVDVAGAPYRVVREVKVFEANTAALLETAINAWMTLLYASPIEYFVVTVNPYSPSNKHAAVVSYGYFVPSP